jgi:hypothetical protein
MTEPAASFPTDACHYCDSPFPTELLDPVGRWAATAFVPCPTCQHRSRVTHPPHAPLPGDLSA